MRNINELTPEQVKMIRAHLNLGFFHAIDTETLKDKSDIEKLKCQKIHDGAKSGDSISSKEFDELVKSIQHQDSQAIQAKDWMKSYFPDDSKITYKC